MKIYCKSFYTDKNGVNKRLSFKLHQAGVGHLVEVIGVAEVDASRAQNTITRMLSEANRGLAMGTLSYRVDEAKGVSYPKLTGYLQFSGAGSADDFPLDE